MLCFCGEATHQHYYSTVHGAWETGRREARRLLEYWKDAAQPGAASKLLSVTDQTMSTSACSEERTPGGDDARADGGL